MKYTTILFALCSAVFISACTDEPAKTPANAVEASPTAMPALITPTDGMAKLNPPHGEPGHVCEIAVGAPLDGSAPPANIVTDPTSTGGSNSMSVPPPMFNSSPATSGMELPSGTPNPAHGEPGHKCELQVGDPLP